MKNWRILLFFCCYTPTLLVRASNGEKSVKKEENWVNTKFFVGPKEGSSNYFAKHFTNSKVQQCQDKDISEFLQRNKSDSKVIIAQAEDVEVHQWTRPSDKKVMAVKRKFEWDEEEKDFLREVNLLNKCKDEGFTANIDCIFHDTDGHHYYMMEYLPGNTLREMKFYNPETDNFNAKWGELCFTMASIVKKLHSKKVLHLDMHLGNWMVTPEGRLYLIDFSKAQKPTLFFSYDEDISSLGDAFQQIFRKMLVSLSGHLKLHCKSKSLDYLKNDIKKVDIVGIEDIIYDMTVMFDRDRSSLKKVIADLESFFTRNNSFQHINSTN